MNPWMIVALAFASPVLILAALVWRCRGQPICPACCYPTYKCECPRPCEHDEYWGWRWTEDGWVKVCQVCGAPAYGGDGPEPVEPE